MVPITVPVVQHKDIAATRKDYDKFGSDILVTSMFLTIQGEGPYAGHPAIFVRLAGCNYGQKDFACQFCDTAFEFRNGQRYSPRDLADAVLQMPGYNPSQVLVLTGGEPTLQHNLLDFIQLVSPCFSTIQLETNGTQAAFYKEAGDRGLGNHFKSVVSPKANLKAGRYAELSREVMWWASCLKFVVTANENDPHHTVPEWALKSAKAVYVSPMALYTREYQGEVSSIWDPDLIDKEGTAKNYAYAADYAIKNNLLLSLQTHLFLGMP